MSQHCCDIESYAVRVTDASGQMYANGPSTTQTVCKTHQWYWAPGSMMTTADEMCPLGRIEHATQVALAKIAAEK